MSADDEPSSAQSFISHLIRCGLMAEAAAQRVLSAMEATGHATDTVFTELGVMRETAFAQHASEYLGTVVVEDPLPMVELDMLAEMGLEFSLLHGVLPVTGADGQGLSVVAADPFDSTALEMIEYLFNRRVEVKVCVRGTILAALAAIRAQAIPDKDDLISNPGAYEDDLERLRSSAQQAPIVRLVSKISQVAFDEGATDIHFEPFDHNLRIRLRIDGELKLVDNVPSDLLPGISTRIKLLAGLDISERRLPQDGRMRLTIRGQEVDLRVSFIPAIHGETIVLRLLDRSRVTLDLKSLGFEPEAFATLHQFTGLPNGMVLVAGPTGSGKTTTLYAMIALLNRPNLKIFTIEDPVEYRMNGVTQVQVNSATGMTFARALRSVLRQDPDIVLVGEIRDRETAEIAMQAALTGHLVFSTLHTNSAAGAITRLRNMGSENYLIGATLKGIISQRLVRRCCDCGLKPADCPRCGGSGLKGRTVTYEIAEISPFIADRISTGDPEALLQEALERSGFISLERHALSLAERGVTNRSEVARTVRLSEVGTG